MGMNDGFDVGPPEVNVSMDPPLSRRLPRSLPVAGPEVYDYDHFFRQLGVGDAAGGNGHRARPEPKAEVPPASGHEAFDQ